MMVYWIGEAVLQLVVVLIGSAKVNDMVSAATGRLIGDGVGQSRPWDTGRHCMQVSSVEGTDVSDKISKRELLTSAEV